MSEKVQIAVVGTGWWSTTAHIPSLLANPRVDLVLVDKNPDTLRAAAANYNVSAAYTSISDAVAAQPKLKGAIVAVQHKAHDEVGKQVLEHGLHLLMEKPMTLTAKGAKALVDMAQSKGVQILMRTPSPTCPRSKLPSDTSMRA